MIQAKYCLGTPLILILSTWLYYGSKFWLSSFRLLSDGPDDSVKQ